MSKHTVSAWRDKHGDVWTEGDDGLMHAPETRPFPREHVEKKWGPLEDVSSRLALWVRDPAPGGWICAACLHPIESEPCEEHGTYPPSFDAR